ncbi:MAG: site-2 protease family protein [Clostridia bacterium]|nr:site-2 protease family protein [Clostridia bacterium]
MSRILSIIAALVVLSIFVTVHELGHFIVGCLLKFRITGFSIGMGPVLFGREKNGTLFAVRAFPIGGMCQFYGEDSESGSGEGFNDHPVWKRFLVVLAGPVMNLLLALILSVAALSAYGNYMPQIAEIMEGTPAATSDLKQFDIVTAVDGTPVTFYSEVFDMITDCMEDSIHLTVIREGRTEHVTIDNIYNEEKASNFLGVSISPARLRYSFAKSLIGAFSYVGGVIRQTFAFFGVLLSGKAQPGDVAGPVGTIAYISEAVRYGFEPILQLSILINISLGIMNLLPIPALDGGRILFFVVEAISGKPIDRNKEGLIHMIGFILLIGLIVFLTYNDISNLISGNLLQ